MKRLFYIVCLLAFPNLSSATNYYWVGGTGAWSDYANHWATSSGGTVFHVTIPSPFDDVFFDSNSFPSTGDTVYMDTTITNCHNMDWSGVTNTPTLSGSMQLRVYGSFILSPNMNWKGWGSLSLRSTTTAVINTGGLALGVNSSNDLNVMFEENGIWQLQSSLSLKPGFSIPGQIILSKGSLKTNGYPITCSVFRVNGTSITLKLDTSVVRCEQTLELYSQSHLTLQLDADSAVIITGTVNGGTGFVYHNIIGNIEADSCTFDEVSGYRVRGNGNSYGLVTMNSSQNYVYGNGCTFGKLIMPGSSCSINGSHQYDTLIFNNPGQSIELQSGSITTVNDLQGPNGSCNGLASLTSSGTATISKSSGTMTFNYVRLQNIVATGGAVFVANNSVNAGNVSGITVNTPVPQNLYWVGGTGTWSDVSHWAASSGGTGGSCVPSQYDNVYFDGNSFSSADDTVYTAGATLYCRDMDWSGVTNTPTLSGSMQLRVYGSFILSPNMNWKGWGSLSLRSTTTAVINTGGLALGVNSSNDLNVMFEENGIWQLQSSLSLKPGFSIPGQIILSKGSLKTNGYPITCSVFRVNGTSITLKLDTSVVRCEQTLELYSQSHLTLQLDADSAVIITGTVNGGTGFVYHNIIGNIEADSCTFDEVSGYRVRGNGNSYGLVTMNSSQNYVYGNGCTFGKLIMPGSSCSINGSHQYDTLIFNNPGQSIELQSGSITTVNDLQGPNGSCNGLASLTSSGTATISKSSGTMTFNYVRLQNISATGGASFVANNSVNAGNVTGITVNTPTPQNLYWVGGTGTWSDVNHWATSSGGTGGSCVPSQFDNVFFDGNSFSSADDTVYTAGATIYCRDMDWSGVTNTPTFSGSMQLRVYGSFILSANMNWNGSGSLSLRSTGAATIQTGGHFLGALPYDNMDLEFDESGTWQLQSSLNLRSGSNYGHITIYEGSLNTNGYPVSCGILRVSGSNSTTLLLDTSVVTCLQAWDLDSQSPLTLQLDADSAVIVSGSMYGGTGYAYHHVIGQTQSDSCTFDEVSGNRVDGEGNSYDLVTMNGSNNYVYCNGSTFGKLILPGSTCSFTDSNQYDTLIFNNPGQSVTLSNGSVTTVDSSLIIQSDPGFPSSIKCLSGSATISKPADTVCADFIYLQNIHATGGAQFYAGDHSVDLGGNMGWNWTRCVPLISNVWPGDCNYDLVTDNLDLLNIGVAMGDTGYVRPSASLSYVAQPCQDWYWQFINAVNVKHADCNGNGTVDVSDTTAISLNYGLTHPARPAGSNQSTSTGTDLILQLPAIAVAPGSVISAPVILGTNGNPANNIYGMAFTIDYDSSYIQPGSMSIDYSGSWVAGAGNYLHIEKDFPSEGKLDMAFTRYNHSDVSGYGQIGTLNFTVSNSASGLLNMSFSKVKIISHNELEIPVVTQSTSLTVNVNEIRNSTPLYLYPNPAREELFLTTGPLKSRKAKIIVTDMLGQEMFRLEQATDQGGRLSTHLQLDDLGSGIYLLRIETEKERLIQKFVKE